jgi:hypothetical protein
MCKIFGLSTLAGALAIDKSGIYILLLDFSLHLLSAIGSLYFSILSLSAGHMNCPSHWWRGVKMASGN